MRGKVGFDMSFCKFIGDREGERRTIPGEGGAGLEPGIEFRAGELRAELFEDLIPEGLGGEFGILRILFLVC